jgi:hypothetical protein
MGDIKVGDKGDMGTESGEDNGGKGGLAWLKKAG